MCHKCTLCYGDSAVTRPKRPTLPATLGTAQPRTGNVEQFHVCTSPQELPFSLMFTEQSPTLWKSCTHSTTSDRRQQQRTESWTQAITQISENDTANWPGTLPAPSTTACTGRACANASQLSEGQSERQLEDRTSAEHKATHCSSWAVQVQEDAPDQAAQETATAGALAPGFQPASPSSMGLYHVLHTQPAS